VIRLGKPIRIGWFSDWAYAPTGFGTVARNVLTRLNAMPEFEVRQLAIGYDPWQALGAVKDPVQYREAVDRFRDTRVDGWSRDLPSPVGFPCDSPLDANDYGQSSLQLWIDRFAIDVLVCNFDPWMTAWMPCQGTQQNLRCPVIYYQPIDGEVWGHHLPIHLFKLPKRRLARIAWRDFMLAQEYTVLYGDWARQLFLDELDEDERAKLDGRLDVIPHGVDLKTFVPGSKIAARQTLGLPENAYIIGMVATNQARKNWPDFLKAVGAFLHSHPNAYLVPWTEWLPSMPGGWDLTRLIPLTCPTKRVVRIDLAMVDETPPVELLATLYQALDVHVLWSMGEGCGLPHLEAQACGRPSLAVDYAGVTDYFSDDYMRVPYTETVTASGNCIERARGDTGILLQKLAQLCHDHDLRDRLGTNAAHYARAHWNWDHIVLQWRELIMRAYKEGRRSCDSDASSAAESNPDSPMATPALTVSVENGDVSTADEEVGRGGEAMARIGPVSSRAN